MQESERMKISKKKQEAVDEWWECTKEKLNKWKKVRFGLSSVILFLILAGLMDFFNYRYHAMALFQGAIFCLIYDTYMNTR